MALGITIRMGATRNELQTPDGQVFDLNKSDKKKFSLSCELIQQYLKVNGFFGGKNA